MEQQSTSKYSKRYIIIGWIRRMRTIFVLAFSMIINFVDSFCHTHTHACFGVSVSKDGVIWWRWYWWCEGGYYPTSWAHAHKHSATANHTNVQCALLRCDWNQSQIRFSLLIIITIRHLLFKQLKILKIAYTWRSQAPTLQPAALIPHVCRMFAAFFAVHTNRLPLT